MRRRILIGGVLLVGPVVIGLLALWAFRDDGGQEDDLLPGGPPPPEVLETLARLEGDAETQRGALRPELVELLEEDGFEEPVVPLGSTVELDDDAWRSGAEGHGGVRGRLVAADGDSTPIEIGLTHEDGAWLVSYISEGE